ncbi:MAG: methionine gamma-lyase family protein [Thermoflavifilum sp.]|nr:methionine gamma-lyase family protein [Thermoflavifilum sp.]MCL6514559.1 methionine gamma-lyase family protein [Alicyclobacillus sp.]
MTTRTEHVQWIEAAEQAVAPAWRRIAEIALANQRKVLDAFRTERVSEVDLHGSTGYGLDDEGRDKLERVFARALDAEAALVRPQIISGTHAIRLALFGVLRPGDHFIIATGQPYDTLEAVIGIRSTPGSLAEWSVQWTQVDLRPDGRVDTEAVLSAWRSNTRLVLFQRSRGYSQRPALSVGDMADAFARIRAHAPDVIIAVDNCYGEFTEEREPTAVGADLIMGSLIKNPGAGLARTGGYVAGRHTYVVQAAAQLTAPGIGAEMGPTRGMLEWFYQGLFMAPHVVGQALRGSVLAAKVLADMGFEVSPAWDEPRSDLILAVRFPSADKLLAFCRAVQSVAPVDAHALPEPESMAGYADPVVMAAGTFVQGSSIELSADAPLRPPFIGYLQGGLTYEHVRIALEEIVRALVQGS